MALHNDLSRYSYLFFVDGEDIDRQPSSEIFTEKKYKKSNLTKGLLGYKVEPIFKMNHILSTGSNSKIVTPYQIIQSKW